MPKPKEFWNMMINWLTQLSVLNLKNIPIFNKCTILGFPDPIPEPSEKIHVINICIFFIKYYIYIQRLSINNLVSKFLPSIIKVCCSNQI